MASKIDLISSALVLVGDTPINSLTGNSRQQQVANSLYDNTVENELTKHRWGFARRKAQLSLTTITPIDNDWRSVYQLPTDLLVLIKLNPRANYQIYGDKVYTNLSQALYCDYIKNVAESEWPVYFDVVAEYALAIKFASAIRDNLKLSQDLKQSYLIESAGSRLIDSQQHPQTPIVDRPLIDVRF